MKVISMQVLGESGVEYTVDVSANGSARCSCPSFRYQTRWCKHLAFVFDFLGADHRQLA